MKDLTGCWFDPAIDGSGLVIDDAPETRVVYLYTYAEGLPGDEKGGQLWLIGQPEDKTRPDHLSFYRPEGTYLGKTYKLGAPVAYGSFEMDGDRLVFEFRLTNLGRCKPVMPGPHPPECRPTKWILQRLTRRS
jgi:hypothetical protein